MSDPIRTIQAPDLSEVSPLDGEQLDALNRGLKPALDQLGMGGYVDTNDTYWFGIHDGTLPAHDRWFFAVDSRDVRGLMGHHTLPFQTVLHCGSGLIAKRNGLNFLSDELQSLNQEINDALDDRPATLSAGFKREEHTRKILSMYRTFGYLGIDYSNDLLGLRWDQDVHDLLLHPEVWLERNPEAAGLPRDLVLRMHGLGEYAASRNAGLDWLNVHASAE